MARALLPALGSGSAVLASFAIGCGGGMPLMHGAQALGPGVTATGVGFSGTFTAGHARDAIEADQANPPASAKPSDVALRAGAVRAAMAPSVAPWLGGRVGVAGDNEVGLAFTGRAIRVDARHAFESGPVAFSLGAGGIITLRGMDPIGDGPSGAVHVRSGYGFDVPALVGWRSDAGVVSLWGGARGGLESIDLWTPGGGTPMALFSDTDLLRRYVGGVAGVSMGLRHVHVALELDVLYQWVSGNFADTVVKVDGVTLSPAGALIFTF